MLSELQSADNLEVLREMLSRFGIDLLSYGQDTPSSALEIRPSAFSYGSRDPSSYIIGPPSTLDALPSVQITKAPHSLKLADRLLAHTLAAVQLLVALSATPWTL